MKIVKKSRILFATFVSVLFLLSSCNKAVESENVSPPPLQPNPEVVTMDVQIVDKIE